MGKARKAERTPAQRELDAVRIVEMKRARRTSDEIAEVLNRDRDPEQHITAATVRSQWAAYSKRLAAKSEEDGRKLLEESIREHAMDRAEALRAFAAFLETGNASAPSFLMVAHRCQIALDRLRGVKPHEQKEGQEGADSGKPFESIEEAREYLTRTAGLGGRVLPYADTRRKKG
jgi:hypothetical protein